MKIINTTIPDVIIFEPKAYGDERGFFFESFNQKIFDEAIGQHIVFVQDNHSRSSKNVLRGLHYQLAPYAQGKLVRCIAGSVLDVAVDIRKESPSYGRWVSIMLSAENKRQLWIPEGFAHGFLSLEDETEFLYKTTNFYSPENERAFIWNDPTLNIEWGIQEPIVSAKDKLAPFFDVQ
ncbi:TPA: dTDP-4-dehydrorhamnose 3,5-epimerase [Citrobacter farmeri]|uniref:dTDP-4-dehydrorhamnose 3,5-epimerase n=1 Tax=Citrobacter farmeri TaxID=67824 RepID=UPI00388D5B7E|nr:dTDP-4-dehydrorhamnose 3,5-epimerase [Citrobacter farmeri]